MHDQTARDTSWRAIAIGSFLTLVFVAVAWNIAAFAIDSSSLQQEWESSTTTALALAPLLMVVYCGWAFIFSFSAAVAAAIGSRKTPADQAFGATSIALALVLLAPAVLCVRRMRSAQSEAARAISLL